MMAEFGEKLKYLLKIGLVETAVSSIIVNTGYSLLNMEGSLR